MRAELNFKQELVGCFGYPVAENPTQAMVKPAFRSIGSDWRYLTLEARPEKPNVEYGIMTDTDLLAAAKQYFGVSDMGK